MSEPKSVDRTIRVITEQKVIDGAEPVEGGYLMRKWNMQIFLLDAEGNEVPASIFEKVVYHLHPTFAQPTRTFKKPPFRLDEEGWGEFDLGITLTFVDKAGDRKIPHDLHFQAERYVSDHVIHCPLNKSDKLRKILAESGAVPSHSGTPGGDTLGDKRKAGSSANLEKKRSKLQMGSTVKGSVDMEKLAEAFTKLSEDDLLGVVQMVTDNRTSDMNIKNDVEEGEFTMDLYTLPDSLLKSLWEYVKKRTD